MKNDKLLKTFQDAAGAMLRLSKALDDTVEKGTDLEFHVADMAARLTIEVLQRERAVQKEKK